jgi:hypothetical protein
MGKLGFERLMGKLGLERFKRKLGFVGRVFGSDDRVG